ncbi:Fic family protein [Pseudomonas sp. LS-2]|uniref:Fic family protein n=1 Tax=Pseudomonas sp. LS-2 TaxID=2315859 RepID=UPI000E755CD5|nr:Fic family protein [Pseudomonas sp. LS-2]RJX82161.1 Fic family protein [Pseudomonas sp. LS-2]
MALTPYITTDRAPSYLKDAADKLLQLDAALSENVPESLRAPMIHLQRQVSAYYSNRIEGNLATPGDVLRAQDDPAGDTRALDLLEIRSHIEAQISLSIDPIEAAKISNRESIARMHRELYRGVPEKHLRINVEAGGQPIPLVPGEIRALEVRVGHHIPPFAEKIRSYLTWFEAAYRLDRLHGLAPLLAAAGAHHRFLWLHPFVDGNGRTGRLFTDVYLKAGGLKGYGLWSMSRGFGRHVDKYYGALKSADHVRKGDLDGRGELSDSGLIRFTEYFITTALEQARFVSTLLEPRTLNRRIDHYFHMRQQSAFSKASGEALAILRTEALQLYRTLLERGPMQCSEIQARLGLGEFTARKLFGQMASEGLIATDEDGQVSIRLPGHLIMTLFPNLFDSSHVPGGE